MLVRVTRFFVSCSELLFVDAVPWKPHTKGNEFTRELQIHLVKKCLTNEEFSSVKIVLKPSIFLEVSIKKYTFANVRNKTIKCMIDIIKALKENRKEASRILSDEVKGGILTFANWDEDEEEYSNADQCPYIRYANVDGDIHTELVVAARCNEFNGEIEIISTESEYEVTNGVWYPLSYVEDISYWQVLEAIGNHEVYENK